MSTARPAAVDHSMTRRSARGLPPATLSPDQVREMVVAAQRIPHAQAPGEAEDAADVLRSIGLVQLDPLTRVSTAQRLTCLTRLSWNQRAEDVDRSLWPGKEPVAFEAFTKVACLFPIEDWPLLQVRRDQMMAQAGPHMDPGLVRMIRDVVVDHPKGARIGEIERACGPERTSGWDWSRIKKTAEQMVRTGELVITARDGTTRLFDLPERALPARVRSAPQHSTADLLSGLARRAVSTLAVMTTADFAHHYALRRSDAQRGVDEAGLRKVTVEGWKDPAFVPPTTDSAPETAPGHAAGAGVPARHSALGAVREARLVGPFDPLLRDRSRARRIFGFDYTFEAYVPAADRRYGHYVMAVLSGDRLIGRVDLQRESGQLMVNATFAERGVRRREFQARARAACATLARQLGTALVFR